MSQLIAIVSGEPNSINSEIIGKTWKLLKIKKNLFIIGNYFLLKKQLNKINFKIRISKINSINEIKNKDILYVLDVPLKFKSPFKISLTESRKYVIKSLDIAHILAVKKKIKGFINAPINKKIFNNKYLGVTEYLAFKNNVKGKELMIIYNKRLSVVPLTTHLEIKNVTKKIKINLIKNKVLVLRKYYNNIFKKEPRIAILGLNPHNSENRKNSVEKQFIKPSVKILKKLKVNILGPFPADTAFSVQKRIDFDVIVGMYHDQVLAPFKALYNYDAINITLGLKYLRVSPDHGTALDIVGLNKANPQSMLSAVHFLKKIND